MGGKRYLLVDFTLEIVKNKLEGVKVFQSKLFIKTKQNVVSPTVTDIAPDLLAVITC